jgi:hypothetical protein
MAAATAAAPALQGYANSIEHLKAEFERLDVLLRRQVERLRRRQPPGEPLAALYISNAEIDALLDQGDGQAEQEAEQQRLVGVHELLSARTAAQIAASRARGVVLRLDLMMQRCRLTPLERDMLLVALAPEIAPRYRRLYAYLQADATLRRPELEFAFDLICDGPDDRLQARRIIAAEAPLRRNRLLNLICEGPAVHLKIEDGVLDYLIGFDHLDPRLADWVRRVEPQAGSFDALQLPAAVADRLSALATSGPPQGGLVLHLQGRYGSGRRAAAEALAQSFAMPVLIADAAHVVALADSDARLAITLIAREALLHGAAVYWDGFDHFLDDARRASLSMLIRLWSDGVVFLAGERSFEPRGLQARLLRVTFPPPGARERLALWRRALADGADSHDDVDLAALANGFRLTGGEIRDALTSARNAARWRGDKAVTLADLQAACRLHSSQGLAALGQKIDTRYGWSDLVLPPDRMQQLREITDGIKYRGLVLDEWGFGQKLSLGKGPAALFAGSSGTGKTMAAEVIAGELGLDLYKIDLSAVVSKFIGETEKNLARIFAEAETSNSILFFDEADALFGKRSEVRDAHDRYANIETAYLLQRLEAYDGLVILATNIKKNMDEAFVRRLQTVIEFPLPAEADRRRMWSKIWPEAMPLGADVDFDGLARLELAGGSIKNIALAAAFLAAADDRVVTMTHVLRATHREFQKMGRILAPGELALAGTSGTAIR